MRGNQLDRCTQNHICLILLCVVILFMTAEGVRCDPGKHQYYHPQADECMDCERCNPGEERIPLEEWDHRYDNKTGPTECRPCRPCGEGTFSRRRAFQCRSCRNCSETEVIVSECTSTKNTVCGPKPTTQINIKHKLTTEPPKVEKNRGNDHRWISLIVILIFVTIIVIVVLSLCCLRRKPPCRKNSDTPINQVEQRTMPNAINTLFNIENNNGTINYFANPIEINGHMEQGNAGITNNQGITTSYSADNENDGLSADDESSYSANVPAMTTTINEQSQTSESSEGASESDSLSEDTTRVWKPVRNTNFSFFKRQNSYPFDETVPKFEREPFLRS